MYGDLKGGGKAEMKENLFDFIENQMFTLFSTEKYRRKNYTLLSFVYDLFVEGKRRQAIPRQEVVAAIREFAVSKSLYVGDNEDGGNIKTPNDYANYKVRQLVKCGWLEEEADDNDRFSTVLLLSDGAIVLMQAFRNIIDSAERPIAYSGYFYTVARLLQDFEKERSKTILEQVRKTTQDLFSSLQGINSVIKRFIAELLEEKDATPESIMANFLYDYQNKVVLTALSNLMGKDNPSKYLDEIISKLRSLSGPEFNSIVFFYSQELDRQTLGRENPMDVARREVRQILDECLESYSTVNEFIDAIAERNSKYHRNTKDKIHFLMNTRKDIEGEIGKSIRALKDVQDDASFEDVIPLEYVGLVDDRSLFSRIPSASNKAYVQTEIPAVTEEQLEKARAEFRRQNLFSREEICAYVLKNLGERKTMKASEIPIHDYDDLYRLLLIRIYAQYRNVEYTLMDSGESFVSFHHHMSDFVIRRKEKAR